MHLRESSRGHLQAELSRHALDPRNPDTWIVFVLIASLALRVWLIAQPMPWVVSMLAADDFFYYAQTTYHLAEGHGSTVDGGITFHNGYHPLFLWMLVPGFALGLGKAAMIQYAMAILTAAWMVALFLAYRIGRRLGGRWSALGAPVVLGLNVEMAKVSLSGFETALAVALLLAVVWATLERSSGWKIGLLLGLAGLARVDSGLASLPVAIALVQQRRWHALFVTAAVAATVVSPWVIWSWSNFGSPLPLSGVVKAWHGRPEDLWLGPIVYARESAYQLLGYRWRDLIPSDVALVIGALAIAEAMRRGGREWWLLLYALGAPFVFAVLTGAHLVAQFNRYCVPAFALLAVAFFVRLWRWQRTLLALVAISVLWGSHFYLDWAMRSPPIGNYVGLSAREVPRILATIVGPDDLVGSFDSGALAYFAELPVVNLDGLVNAEIVTLLGAEEGGTWEARFRSYFADKGITVIVGGTAFEWVHLFADLSEWPVLHEPLQLDDGSSILFLRVPDHTNS